MSDEADGPHGSTDPASHSSHITFIDTPALDTPIDTPAIQKPIVAV